ncbi:unnamed protein product, partial [Prorocentrum cordatum]
PPGVSNAPPPPSAARPRGRELGSARPARPGQGAMSAMVLRIALAALAAARLAAAVPGGVEKIVCEVLSQRSLERGAANATCAEVQELAEKYPGVITPYQDCAERFEHFWEKAAAACPKHRRHFDLPADIPEDIKKELCDVASQKDVEEKAIKYVCEKVKDEVNPVECNLVLKAAWAHALEDCSPNKTAPSPADIEKLICEYASQQPIEDKAVEEICEVVTAKFPSVPDCKGMVEAAWDKALAMCPKQQAMLPSPADIEKLICEYASQQPIEDKAVEEICEVVTAKFPSVPDCKGMVEAAWDKALAMCPKEQLMAPSPADIEKLICEFASKKQIEDKAVEEVCQAIADKFPSIKFDPDCKTVMEFGGGGGHVPQAEPRDAHVRLRRSPAKPCDAVASSRVGGPRAGSGEGSPRREGRRCTTSRGRPPGGRPRSAPLLGRLARRLRAGVHTQPLGERALQRPVRCSDGLQGSEVVGGGKERGDD